MPVEPRSPVDQAESDRATHPACSFGHVPSRLALAAASGEHGADIVAVVILALLGTLALAGYSTLFYEARRAARYVEMSEFLVGDAFTVSLPRPPLRPPRLHRWRCQCCRTSAGRVRAVPAAHAR